MLDVKYTRSRGVVLSSCFVNLKRCSCCIKRTWESERLARFFFVCVLVAHFSYTCPKGKIYFLCIVRCKRRRREEAFHLFPVITTLRSFTPPPPPTPQCTKSCKYKMFIAVFRIHDILVRIRIHGSVPLTNGSKSGSGCCSFQQWPSRCQRKIIFFQVFFSYYFLNVHLIHGSQIKNHKDVTKQ
jgi:hypothetical protein